MRRFGTSSMSRSNAAPRGELALEPASASPLFHFGTARARSAGRSCCGDLARAFARSAAARPRGSDAALLVGEQSLQLVLAVATLASSA